MLRPFVRQWTAQRPISAPAFVRTNRTKVFIDSSKVPVHPTWSVEQLLSTYPIPVLSHDTIARLHRLSALFPPKPNSPEADSLRLELQQLLRLVEAVKLIDTSALGDKGHAGVPDSRIWVEERGIDLDAPGPSHLDEPHGKALLSHASKHVDEQYVVETAPRPQGKVILEE